MRRILGQIQNLGRIRIFYVNVGIVPMLEFICFAILFFFNPANRVFVLAAFLLNDLKAFVLFIVTTVFFIIDFDDLFYKKSLYNYVLI